MLVSCPSELDLLLHLLAFARTLYRAHRLNLLLSNCLVRGGLRKGCILDWGSFFNPKCVLLFIVGLRKDEFGFNFGEWLVAMFFLNGLSIAECEYVGRLL